MTRTKPPVVTGPAQFPNKPFISRELRLTYEALRRSIQERFLNTHGVSYPHWAYLRVLWETDGMTQSSLSKAAARVGSNTVAIVNGMVKAGYVKRVPSESDRRTIHIFLTPEGRALRTKLHPKGRSVEEVALANIPPKHVTILRETLKKMRANLGE
jgi:DNA-binding MarR family transcriptional regulator